MTFSEFTKERIFKPLGMANSDFKEIPGLVVEHRAQGYMEDGNDFTNSDLGYASAGATNLYTTSGDLIKWINNFETGALGGKSLVEKMLLTGSLANGLVLDYGKGLYVSKWNEDQFISHPGIHYGYNAFRGFVLNKRLGVVILSNRGSLKSENDYLFDKGVKSFGFQADDFHKNSSVKKYSCRINI